MERSAESRMLDSGTGVETLSRRELEVLRLVSNGSTNRQISTQLGLTVHGVKFHLASVYRKLGVTNRTEAVVSLLMSGDHALESGQQELN